KTYNLKSFQGDSSLSAPIAAIYVEKKGTVVEASQITVLGDNPDTISAYGGYVKDGGTLILTDSNFKDAPSLRADNAVIKMTEGSIMRTSHAVYATGKATDVALVRVNIEIVPDNLKTKEIGIVSGFGAYVRMSGSTVNFKGAGSFLSRFGGRYLLDTMTIKGEGKKEGVTVDDVGPGALPKAFEVSQGGNVYLRDNSIQLTDMHGFLIENFSGYVDDNGKLLQKYNSLDSFKKTNIKIESSDISVQGEGTHGLYFHVLGPEESADILNPNGNKSSEVKKVIAGAASVSLSKTIFEVPNGIAIYATGGKGYRAEGTLELSEESKISGDLLLKAKNNASLSIKANNSVLIGGMSVEDTSTVGLQLMRGSRWYLKKSKYSGSQESDF
ncbi:hypothetical protein MCO_01711, partial [Bartonella sp. DB5-6]